MINRIINGLEQKGFDLEIFGKCFVASFATVVIIGLVFAKLNGLW